MSKLKRLRKLLSAQHQLEGLALAASAQADNLLAGNIAENAAFVRNASGDNQQELAAIAALLCNTAQRSVRARELSRTAEQCAETAKAEGRLRRHLQRLIAARTEVERKNASRRSFADQLEAMAATRQPSVAPVWQDRVVPKREETR